MLGLIVERSGAYFNSAPGAQILEQRSVEREWQAALPKRAT